MKQKLIYLKGEIDKSPTVVGDFNTSFLIIDVTCSRYKYKYKEKEDIEET